MRSRSCASIVAILAAVFVASACARQAPEPSLTSAEGNVAYAVSAICAPFVLDGVDEARLPTHQQLVHGDGWNEQVFQRLGTQPVRVGFAGFVHVGVSASGGNRECDITAARADPQALRQAALTALAVRPEHFAPTKSRYLPGRFATEDMLCASADSAHPTALVLLSSPRPEESSKVALIFTLSDAGPRMQSCDQAGVPMNYRTLAAGG